MIPVDSLPDPWQPAAENASALERELCSEVAPGHPLHGRSCRAVARRIDCDEVLFEVGSTQLAVVHLTWRGAAETNSNFPATSLYDSFEDLVRDESC
ncbi:MAG TPA: hypothetical protein VMP01_22550 [Pirellulaceae bacterium]|nr:hypothetical protein [Pirellulaceae bacterium]